MIALVEYENRMIFSQLFGDGLPVVKCTEQTVQDDNGVALAESFIVEFQSAKLYLCNYVLGASGFIESAETRPFARQFFTFADFFENANKTRRFVLDETIPGSFHPAQTYKPPTKCIISALTR